MLRAVGYPLVYLAIFSLAGGHWAVLQTVAWAGMLRAYAKEATLSVAVSKTFDGAHPCTMCKKIAQEKKKEAQVPPTFKIEKKSELFVDVAAPWTRHNFFRQLAIIFPDDDSYRNRFDSPPRPVPRAVLS